MKPNKTYLRTGDTQTIYLKSIITRPTIEIGDFTIYNDFVNDPRDFEKNNVLYHYPINHDRLIIGKFCSIACGAKFIFNCANHTLNSLSTYTFPLFFEEWDLPKLEVATAWDNKGDIVIGNDVWIGYDAVIMWKTQARMPPAAKVCLTPKNFSVDPLRSFGRRGHFYFGLLTFCSLYFTHTLTGQFDTVSRVDYPVEYGICHSWVSDSLIPVCNR